MDRERAPGYSQYEGVRGGRHYYELSRTGALMYDVVVIGGGAAGFYAAIHIAEADSNLKIAILERGKEVLAKVRVSGGGRCNVAHAEFDPKELVKNYPRGEKELLGPFHTYASGDTVAFFEKRGISLKIEEDGRMFPTTDSSQTIIDCFTSEAKRLGIAVFDRTAVQKIEVLDNMAEANWKIITKENTFTTDKVVVATGSNPKIWTLLEELGHTIVAPVPSLFTFNISDKRIADIPGLATEAEVTILDDRNSSLSLKSGTRESGLLSSNGPLLITHWGMSGPAILKISAWGARLLKELGYRFTIRVNWVPEYHPNGVLELLMDVKRVERKTIIRTKVLDIPKRLWVSLVNASQIPESTIWPEVTKAQLQSLADQLTNSIFRVDGKSTFKEEFVTAGGVDLKDINFKTYESKILPNLFFAGEVINVDAITGGFNFQNAWTGAYIAAKGIAGSYLKTDQ